jgi:predicted PurR-regulated permease PerM
MPKSDESAASPRFYLLASSAIILTGLYFAQEVLIPIALAILLSFLLGPLVTRLEHLRMPRPAAVILTVVLSFSLLFGIGYIVYNQLGELKSDTAQYKANIHDKLQSLRGPHGPLGWLKTAGTEMKQALAPATEPANPTQSNPLPVRVVNSDTGGSQQSPFDLFRSIGAIVLGPIGTALIVTVFTVFMLLQREDLRDRVIRLVGTNQLTLTTQALDDAAKRVSRYLLMQSIVNGSVGVFIVAALWTIGKINGISFPAVGLWGLLACLLRFIPYVGIWVAALLPVLLSLAVYPHYRVVVETLCAYGVMEAIAGNFFEPLLYGSSTGIATLAVLVAAAFWTWLWGPVGLLLSTPLTVCLVVMGKYVPQLEFLTILLGEEPALSPPDRIYQRLLASDHEEAADLLDEYSKKMPLQELYDTILIPVLTLAEVDIARGTLEHPRHDALQEAVRALIDELFDQAKVLEAKAQAQLLVDQARGDGDAGKMPAVRPGSLPKGCVVNIVCLPASDAADEIAAIMLGQLLELRGYCVLVGSTDHLASERVDSVVSTEADLVCVSALPPAAITHARYLCKRLHAKLPEIEMVVGLWGTAGDLNRARERISFVKSVQLAGSFKQAIDQILQLAQPKIMSMDRDTQPVVSAPALRAARP